jgi:hypothetical protein
MQDPYYSRSEVSNSDLTALHKVLVGDVSDPTDAYRFGSLIDAMLTEPDKVNYFDFAVDGERYKEEEFQKAGEMRKAFMRDEFARKMLEFSSPQAIMIAHRNFEYDYDFELDVRCKWDMWMESFGWGGDIKSTTATTQKQFEAAVEYFDYDRQRAWYMDIAREKGFKADKDVLIAISKKNFKVFKVTIQRGDSLYKRGVEKYTKLAFDYWRYFG